MAKKKKAAAAPPGFVRGYATTSIQKKTVIEPDPVHSAEETALEPSLAPPAPIATATGPSTKSATVGAFDGEDSEDAIVPSGRVKAEQEERLAVLKVEAETQRVDRRRAVIAKDAAVPLLKLADNAEKEIMKFLEESRFVSQVDWFAAESSEPTSRTRLHATYMTLEKLGFSAQHVEDAMTAVGGHNLAGALDWLCLTLLHNLPFGLTDKLDAIAMLPSQPKVEAQEMNAVVAKPQSILGSALPAPSSSARNENKKVGAKADTSAQDMKTWILNNAGYSDDDSSEGDSLDEKSAVLQETVTEQVARLSLEMEEAKYKAADAKAKGDKNRQKKFELSMRNARDEVKYLETQKGYKHGEAQALIQAGRVERPTIIKPVKTELSAIPKPNADEDLPDLLNALFDYPGTLSPKATPTSAPTKMWDLIIGQNWTGKTPKQLLQDFVTRKARGTTIKYFKIVDTAAGLRAGVKFGGGTSKLIEDGRTIEMHYVDRTEKIKEAEEFAAMNALYALASDLPLHRSLPPAYREVWLGWVDEEKVSANNEHKALTARRLAFVESFADLRDARYNSYQSSKPQSSSQGVTQISDTPSQRIEIMDPQVLYSKWEHRQRSGSYRNLLKHRMNLPVYAMRTDIMEIVRQHRVIVVSGETGSGKSTQIPQFIIEDAIEKGHSACRVVCTQPRRISATSIASRVSEELGDVAGKVGSDNSWVGYQVRLENRIGRETMLTFCTIGILLKRLESDYELKEVTHVVVDEVHERSLDSDFLILCLKRLLERRPDLKVILMSATADANRFAAYFERISGVGNVPCLTVPGRTFPVVTHFLEDAIEATGFVVEGGDGGKGVKDAGFVNVSGGGGKSFKVRVQYDANQVGSRIGQRDAADSDGDNDEEDFEVEGEIVDSSTSSWQAAQGMDERTYSSSTRYALANMNTRKINFDLLDSLIRYACSQNAQIEDESARGSILVFLPGLGEIKQMLDRLSGARGMWILGLHSSLGTGDQAKVFQSPPPGHTKIVLSTNIAETGITIPDVTVVIDTMRAREIQFDRKRNVTRLAEVLVSKANALQRRGRAGRVREGVCWHLVDRDQWDRVPSYRPPEMVRVPLEEVCLRVRACGFEGTVGAILNGCVDAPPEKNVERAVEGLKMIQAFTPQEELTPLGRKLSHLPLDTRLGKMLLTAVALQCLDPILTICATISCGKSMFISGGTGERWREFVWGASDLMMAAKAYNAYRSVEGPPRGRRAWCDQKDLSFEVMGFVEETRGQIIKALLDCGVLTAANDSTTNRRTGPGLPAHYNSLADNEGVVMAAIAAGAYPNMFVVDPISAVSVDGKPDTNPVTLHTPGFPSPRVRLHRTSTLLKALGPAGVRDAAQRQWAVAYGVRGGDVGSTYLSCWDFTAVPPVALWCLAGPGVDVQHRLGTLQFAATSTTTRLEPPASGTVSVATATAPQLFARCSPRSAVALAYFGKAVRTVVERRLTAADESELHPTSKEELAKDERVMYLFEQVLRDAPAR
ncbi:ATP-dependent RNA helicase dhx29 [Thoreauomyces humboldtii]|nr:ATP-dependent RNA helicase dhx29 [Thoreauomyces humboldtii]